MLNYAYLGLILNEFLDFNFNLTAKIVAKSDNRALGLVMAKCKTIGGVSCDVYKKRWRQGLTDFNLLS